LNLRRGKQLLSPCNFQWRLKNEFVKIWPTILTCCLFAGCVHYQPQPIAPEKSAAQLDARRLDDAGLKNFVATNAPGKFTDWPPVKWDLDSLTLAAFYFHPDLAVAHAQWQLAVAGIKTAAARPNPVISGGPGYNFTTDTPTPWMPYGSVDLPIETAGKRSKRIAAAESAAESARWNFVGAAWQIRSGIRNALLEFSIAQRRLPLLQKQLDAQREISQLTQSSFAAGESSRPELTTAQLALSKAQLDFSTGEAQLAAARSKLAEAIGISLTALDGVDFAANDSTPLPPEAASAAARRTALLGRTDIRATLADYAVTEENLRLEIAKQYPDIHFNPGYQYDQGDNKWTFGLTLELPLFNQNQGPIAEAKAQRELAAAKFLQLQSQVSAQVDRAVSGWQSAQSQLKTSGELWSAAERQQQSVAAQAKAGAAARMDLASAEIDLAAVRLAQLDNEAQAQTALGALEDALQQPSENFDVLKILSIKPDKKSQP
jgi:outer membrane protein TolC